MQSLLLLCLILPAGLILAIDPGEIQTPPQTGSSIIRAGIYFSVALHWGPLLMVAITILGGGGRNGGSDRR
jgi:hypothetical protein